MAFFRTTLPDLRDPLIDETKAYIAAAHPTIPQFSRYIGAATSSTEFWLRGIYRSRVGNEKNIARKIRAFIDANPVIPPVESRGRFYTTENVATMRRWFDHCLGVEKNKGRMVCVYSGPGGQKTFIAENLIAELNRAEINKPTRSRAFHIYCSQDIRPTQLVVKMLAAAGLPACSKIQRDLASLRFLLRGGQTLFVFDEAQHLSLPCLEVVRELNDLRPYFGVMLLGSHKLRMTFENRAAEMEQWNSRLTASIELPGISDATARMIVREELAGLMQPSDRKIEQLLESCMVQDIYSREKGKVYRSARKLFHSIEQIKDSINAAPIAQPAIAGGVQ